MEMNWRRIVSFLLYAWHCDIVGFLSLLGKEDDIVKLYDLTSLCGDYQNCPWDNPFIVPVALLLYRVAKNMSAMNPTKKWVFHLYHPPQCLIRHRLAGGLVCVWVSTDWSNIQRMTLARWTDMGAESLSINAVLTTFILVICPSYNMCQPICFVKYSFYFSTVNWEQFSLSQIKLFHVLWHFRIAVFFS